MTQTSVHTHSQLEGPIDRHKDKMPDKQTDRQTNRHNRTKYKLKQLRNGNNLKHSRDVITNDDIKLDQMKAKISSLPKEGRGGCKATR